MNGDSGDSCGQPFADGRGDRTARNCRQVSFGLGIQSPESPYDRNCLTLSPLCVQPPSPQSHQTLTSAACVRWVSEGAPGQSHPSPDGGPHHPLTPPAGGRRVSDASCLPGRRQRGTEGQSELAMLSEGSTLWSHKRTKRSERVTPSRDQMDRICKSMPCTGRSPQRWCSRRWRPMRARPARRIIEEAGDADAFFGAGGRGLIHM